VSSTATVRTVRKVAPPRTEEELLRDDLALLVTFVGIVAEGRTHRGTFWQNFAVKILQQLKSREGREHWRFHHEMWRVNGRREVAPPEPEEFSADWQLRERARLASSLREGGK
jgi:hypothetical protein